MEGLMGYLEKTSSGDYEFTKFTFNWAKADSDEPWVKLATLEPNFSTDPHDCGTRGLLGKVGDDDHKYCDTDNYAQIFRSTEISTGDVFQSTVGNAAYIAFSFGLGALSAGGYYTSSFDEDAYSQAVEQAAKRLERSSFIEELSEAKDYKKNTNVKLRNELKNRKQHLEESLKIRVNDKSGLYGSQVPSRFVQVMESKSKRVNFDYQVFSSPLDLKDSVTNQYAELRDTYKHYLHCNESLKDWNFKVDGCDVSYALSGDDYKKGFTVEYTINSKKRGYIAYPFELSDEVISMKTDGHRALKISNNSDKYVVVDSLAFYVDRKVDHKSNVSIELPPRVEKNVSSMLNDTVGYLSLRNFTELDLRKKRDIGAALRYKFVDTGKDKTLYQTKLIDSKMYLQ